MRLWAAHEPQPGLTRIISGIAPKRRVLLALSKADWTLCQDPASFHPYLRVQSPS